MRIVMFYHSLLSDWNHGNAHFLRGVVSELLSRGHIVKVYEPIDAWSVQNLLSEFGESPIEEFRAAYPGLDSIRYDPAQLNLDEALEDADLVLVHEWNEHDLVHRLGRHRKAGGRYRLLFHDTHHRAVTQPAQMSKYDLVHYDGVLAFGRALRELYLKRRLVRRAWVWHEAADTRVFRPLAHQPPQGDLIWIGNWGDDERAAELHEFLLRPVQSLGLKARVHGVRYPPQARAALKDAGIDYANWLPNFRVPRAFARFKATVHVPRRPYVDALPGIPTIRVFEALACAIPLVCSPWHDQERLFQGGKDFLIAKDGAAMQRALRRLINEPEFASALAAHGHQTILSRHTCAHRVDELLNIVAELKADVQPPATRPTAAQRETACIPV